MFISNSYYQTEKYLLINPRRESLLSRASFNTYHLGALSFNTYHLDLPSFSERSPPLHHLVLHVNIVNVCLAGSVVLRARAGVEQVVKLSSMRYTVHSVRCKV